MLINPKSSFLYAGTLDSARTTHYLGLRKNDERWWIPESKDAWEEQMIFASGSSLLRILMGDILCLPRNQFFDSPGWLRIAGKLARMPVPAFSLCLLKMDPTPENFINDITTNVLRNRNFALSGWPGLGMKEREQIARNIDETQGFQRMFRGVRIDSSLKALFELQREALQHMLECILAKRFDHPYVLRRVEGYKTAPWEGLMSGLTDKEFRKKLAQIHGEETAQRYIACLRNMKKELPQQSKAEILREAGRSTSEEQVQSMVSRWLNQRSNLYRAISGYEPEMRYLLSEDINNAYGNSLAESTTSNGRQVSADTETGGYAYPRRQKYLHALDAKGKQVAEASSFAALTYKVKGRKNMLNRLVEVLGDDELQDSMERIREARENRHITKAQMREQEQMHLRKLRNYLPSLIVRESGKSHAVDFTFEAGGLALKFISAATIPLVLAAITTDMLDTGFLGLLALNLGKEAAQSVIEKAVERKGGKPGSARERIKNWVNRQDSKIIAGTVNAWLVEPDREGKRK